VLGTPGKIFYKYEGVSPPVRTRPNTSVPQAYYNKQAGILAPDHRNRRRPMGLLDGLRRPDVRHGGPRLHGQGQLQPEALSPLDDADLGRGGLRQPDRHDQCRPRCAGGKDPNNQGSLGLAISEAVEEARPCGHQLQRSARCSTTSCLHQTIIGLEAKKQFAKIGEYPDMVFAPCGGGSNFAGIAFPFLADKAAGKKVRLVAVEPTSCPS
jgi:tryptophan synthase beta chain